MMCFVSCSQHVFINYSFTSTCPRVFATAASSMVRFIRLARFPQQSLMHGSHTCMPCKHCAICRSNSSPFPAHTVPHRKSIVLNRALDWKEPFNYYVLDCSCTTSAEQSLLPFARCSLSLPLASTVAATNAEWHRSAGTFRLHALTNGAFLRVHVALLSRMQCHATGGVC